MPTLTTTSLRKLYPRNKIYDTGNNWFIVNNNKKVIIIDPNGTERFKGTYKQAFIRLGQLIAQEDWASNQELMTG